MAMDLVLSTRRLLALLAACGFLITTLTGCPGREDEEQEDPCADVVCDSPPANTCDGDVVVSFAATGTCTAGECTYHQDMRTPCDTGEVCVNAECVPDQTGLTCADITCDSPPADRCDGDVRVVYPAVGTCSEGADGPVCDYAPTNTNCAAADEVCAVEGGVPVCVDLCDDVACDPREDHCDDGTAVSYGGAAGTCNPQTGTCEYPSGDETTESCEAHQECLVVESVAACSDLPATCAEYGDCVTPPSAHCSEDGIVSYAETGTCDDSIGYAVCSYEATTTACDDPDAEDYCEGNTRHVWDADGTCAVEGGTPVCNYETDETDCAASDEVCSEDGGPAACVDLCAGVTCPARDDTCEGDVAHTYGGATGTCDWETGDCDYPTGDETTTDCAAGDEVCWVDGGGDAGCYPDPAEQLCATGCTADDQCGRGIDLCVEFEVLEGAFCTQACETASDCGDGYACEAVTSVNGATEDQCVPERGYCFEPICEFGALPPNTWSDRPNCDHPHCTEDPSCAFGYNFGFETWIDGGLPGFYRDIVSGFTLEEEDLLVNTGDRALWLISSSTNNRDLRASVLYRDLAEGLPYTFHVWYQYDGRPDGSTTGFARATMWLRTEDGTLGTGWSAQGPDITAATQDWTETTATSNPVDETRDNLLPFFRIRTSNDAPDGTSNILIDDWAVTVPYTFDVSHTARDGAHVEVASAGDRSVSAAINNAGVLYAATNGAAGGHDRFLYAWVGGVGAGTVDAPWDKAGTVAGPADGGYLFALIQEESNGHCEWRVYDPTEVIWVALTDHTACSGALGDVLSGTIDLAAALEIAPREVPTFVAFAAAGYGTNDGDGLVAATQVPAGNGDGNVDADETETVHRARLLAGKVHD
jgi:hypothetical protein